MLSALAVMASHCLRTTASRVPSVRRISARPAELRERLRARGGKAGLLLRAEVGEAVIAVGATGGVEDDAAVAAS
jgi:hypothetical protein